MANLTHTCLPASPELAALGLTVVVAAEHDRIPLAAFRLGSEASAWCNAKNGLVKPPAPVPGVTPKPVEVTQNLEALSKAAVSHTPGIPTAPKP